jgi:hypothetical protein
MTVARLIVYSRNSQYFLGSGLRDVLTGDYLNSANLAATLNDSSGAPIAGAINMSGQYVSGSQGCYMFQVTGSAFTPASTFTATLIIEGQAAVGSRFHAELPVIIMVRQEGTEI